MIMIYLFVIADNKLSIILNELLFCPTDAGVNASADATTSHVQY